MIQAQAVADAAYVSNRMAQDKSTEEDQASESSVPNDVRAMIDSSHFNDFVDSVQGTGGDDDNLFLLAYSHSANNKEEDQRYL